MRAFVQRALETAADLVAVFDEPGARLRQLRPRVRVGQRLREQAAEPDEPPLTPRRERLLLGGGGHEYAPCLAVAQYRGGDGHAQSNRLHQIPARALGAVVVSPAGGQEGALGASDGGA